VTRPWSGKPVLVVALGGNAITRAGDEPSVQAQFSRTRETCDYLVPVVESGNWRMVITHGNGPQVGNILLRSDLGVEAGELPPLPVDAAVADTQGAMGYMIQQCLSNALWESGIRLPVVTVVTQVLVDENDPAFEEPSKPIGRYYSEGELGELRHRGWVMKEDPGGKGWRRVVPSPRPKEIIEQDIVGELIDNGMIVIACGGGGIPVVAGEGGSLRGVEAVIDKDLASSLLAGHLDADTFVILTEVDKVYLNFGDKNQKPLHEVGTAILRDYHAEGHFPSGSMGPKVEAVVEYLERGGNRAIVTNHESLERALAGRAGTHVRASQPLEAAGGS
jgi:carbamate kinase